MEKTEREISVVVHANFIEYTHKQEHTRAHPVHRDSTLQGSGNTTLFTTLCTGHVSMHGCCHVLPWLNEFSGFMPSFFHAFSPDYFYESITNTTGRLADTSVQGNRLFEVMGQKTCSSCSLMPGRTAARTDLIRQSNCRI